MHGDLVRNQRIGRLVVCAVGRQRSGAVKVVEAKRKLNREVVEALEEFDMAGL